MDKVLFIGHYREASGWGQAARDWILALDSVGVDVVCRPVVFLNNAQIPERIKQLEAKSSVGARVCIQNVLPHLMCYDGDFKKNIALTMTETKCIKYTSWCDRLLMMDEIWVPATYNKRNFQTEGLYSLVVPLAFDISQYNKRFEKIQIDELNDGYTFYFVGEFNRRKNYQALLKAFHLEFKPHENVNLVIKTSKPNTSPENVGREVSEVCEKIKFGINLYKDSSYYKKEIIIPNFIDREELLKLHYTCDTFVCTSFGEGWCIPGFDAYAIGNKIITHNQSNMTEYLTDAYYCCGRYENLFAADKLFSDFSTGREMWFNIDVNDVRKNMRDCYNSGKTKHKPDVSRFSYENIGKLMMERINA